MNVNERLKALLPTIGIFGLISLFFVTIESVLGIDALARMMGANLIVPICCVVILIGTYSSLIKKTLYGWYLSVRVFQSESSSPPCFFWRQLTVYSVR